MEEEKIIDRIDTFLDNEGLDIQSKFILTKKISEEYWEEVLSEGDQTDDDLLGELGDDEDLGEEEPEEEIAVPKLVKKKKLRIKKPLLTTKKEISEEANEETPKEQQPKESEESDTI